MNIVLTCQGSAHTGWEWSAPITTQLFLPPLKLFIPPLTENKSAEMLYFMQFDTLLAKAYSHHSDYSRQNPACNIIVYKITMYRIAGNFGEH